MSLSADNSHHLLGNFDSFQRKDSFPLSVANLDFICYSGLTSERRKPCSATLTPSTNPLPTPTGYKNVSRSCWGPCTRTGTTPSSTSSTSSRPAWNKRTGRRRSPSSTSLILTGGRQDMVQVQCCHPATVNAGQKTLFLQFQITKRFSWMLEEVFTQNFIKKLRLPIAEIF